jgi:hypothetical protein
MMVSLRYFYGMTDPQLGPATATRGFDIAAPGRVACRLRGGAPDTQTAKGRHPWRGPTPPHNPG